MYLSRLYPKPKRADFGDGRPFRFGSRATLRLCGTLDPVTRENLIRLWNRFTFTASRLEINETARGSDVLTAVIGEPSCSPDAQNTPYYSIRSGAGGVLLCARGEKALTDGFSTLVQLIAPVCLERGREDFIIENAEISDCPSVPMRSIHLCVFPETSLVTLEKAIHLAGFLKFTHVALEFWGMLRFDCEPSLSWENAFDKSQIRPLIELCRGYGMQVIPFFNHLGHASQSRCGMGRHTLLNQNPRLQLLFEPDGWTWCVLNPDTLRLLSEIREELIELCGPGDYFHVGCDEAYSFAACPRCREKIPHELLADYLNGLADDLKQRGRRPIIWHDQLIRRADFPDSFAEKKLIVSNGEHLDTWRALEKLDRSYVIADWEYDYHSSENPTARRFIENGFDTLLCPWDDMENVRSLCVSAEKLKARGVMLTTWHHLPAFLPKMFDAADLMWNAQRYGSPLTEAAALLRKLQESCGFEDSGWHNREVEE